MKTSSYPSSIAIIGGGPGGLFLCHHLERLRQQAGVEIDEWPVVRCFEKTLAPGGIWRANANHGDVSSGSPHMYAALWTNGPSHSMEFFDYSYDQHFGTNNPVTVYLPRAQCLSYILARVQHNCPDFMERFVRLGHEVKHVQFDQATEKFDIRIRKAGGVSEKHQFDKCIWACGDNGRGFIPPALAKMFDEGKFPGRFIHSTDTHNLEADVRGKRILLIGGGYSAEDMALQCIKVGARHVFIASRAAASEVTWNEKWPLGKATMLEGYAVRRVKSSTIMLQEVYRTFPHKYKFETEQPSHCKLRNIGTVICCTGYEMVSDMLSDELRSPVFPLHRLDNRVPHNIISSDWTMAPNLLTPLMEPVRPRDVRYYTHVVHPALYRGIFIDNPNFMVLTTYGSYYPLLSLDVYANLLAHYASGRKAMPSTEEMQQHNQQDVLACMNMVVLRYEMDEQYRHRVDYLPNFWDKNDSSPLYNQEDKKLEVFMLQNTARAAREGNYPLDLGTYDELSDKGERVMLYDDWSGEHRYYPEKWNALQRWWRGSRSLATFRDYHDGHKFTSLITGSPAASLPQLWMNRSVESDDHAASTDSDRSDKKIPSLVESL